jgi:Protein of unknown function (DUF1592)/Protein of unknown function (DUF1588)/Protein of unknown function (DUF1595)/Protein of unknown function (DUF1587)/Protein of unknown function (DUF1585)
MIQGSTIQVSILRRILAVSGLSLGLTVAAFAQAQTASDASFFSSRVYPLFEAAGCRGCHVEDGVASGTRLHFPETDASRERVEAFGVSLAVLVDKADPSKSLLLNKPTNRIPHTGQERIKQGSDGEKVLTEWVRYLSTVSDATVAAAKRRLAAGAAGLQPDQFVRRLTHSQYNNTVRDVLGDYSRPSDKFPPEDFVDGFKNQLRTQGMSPILVDAYSTAAEKLALNAFRVGDINNLIPCKATSAADTKCRDQFVRKFGERAFRRPLTDTEVRRYTALFSSQAKASGTFLEGARVVVEAMLQSPKFLFLAESAPGAKNRDYDVASRLSYFLWNTTPDPSLLEAAAKGELRTPDGIEKIARRMLDNPHAHEALDEFFNEWLRLDKVASAVKDERRFPGFTKELAAMMVEETQRMLSHLVWDDRNFMEALTADYSFLTADLSTLYKLPMPANDYQLVHFPAGTPRAGILGQGSFLASTAGPIETSPTARGIFVREQLLCQHVPSPPPGVNTNLPEPTEAKLLTRRQRMIEHVSNATCSSCHRLMDPIGFGLEHYDGVGQYREKEVILIGGGIRIKAKEFDLDLDTSGSVAGLPNSAFSDEKTLGTILAKSPVCQECVVRQIFRYAFGRLETPSDQQTIQQLYTAFRDSGFKFKELLIALVRSPAFLEGQQKPTQTSVAQNQAGYNSIGSVRR